MTSELSTEKQRREIRRLAGLAYEREISNELDGLYSVFREWKDGALKPFDVSDAVHEFHQGPNRELYKIYNGPNASFVVARTVARGLLSRDEVAKVLDERLEQMIGFTTETLPESSA
jgi:hypothetical protein